MKAVCFSETSVLDYVVDYNKV